MRFELKSIGIWAFIKVMFFVNLVIGFIIGFLYALFLIPFISLMGSMSGFDSSAFDGMPSAGLMIVILPIVFALGSAVFNTILALLVAAVYNGFARLVGGFEFTFDAIAETTPAYDVRPPAPQASYLTQTPYVGQTGTQPPPPPPAQPIEPPTGGTQGGAAMPPEEPDQEAPR